MADSDFWRELAANFQALSIPYSDLRADWTYVLKSGTLGEWRIVGDFTKRSHFESLARRAAIRLPEKRSTDLLVAWLTALKEASFGFRMMGVTTAEIGPNYMMGSIALLCEVSANFCRKLESDALQAEFEEKQRARTPAVPEPQTPERFRPLDESYQTVEFDGRIYELTPAQSTVIRVLHAAHLDNRRAVGIKEIQKALGVHSGKMSEWFRRRNHELWARLILHTGKQHYRLDL